MSITLLDWLEQEVEQYKDLRKPNPKYQEVLDWDPSKSWKENWPKYCEKHFPISFEWRVNDEETVKKYSEPLVKHHRYYALKWAFEHLQKIHAAPEKVYSLWPDWNKVGGRCTTNIPHGGWVWRHIVEGPKFSDAKEWMTEQTYQVHVDHVLPKPFVKRARNFFDEDIPEDLRPPVLRRSVNVAC